MGEDKSEYSDNDFLELTEIYFENEWIRKGTNYLGFENLWFDYNTSRSKHILKKLIFNFKYIDQEEAKIETKQTLLNAIDEWKIIPENTLFIAFKMDDFSDGSSIILNFIRPILKEIDFKWKNSNLYTDLEPGLKATSKNRKIENIILIDDFVGTGSSAIDRINKVKEEIKTKDLKIKIFVFSLGGMETGKQKIETISIDYKCTYLIDKGSVISFPLTERDLVKKDILNMENLLYNKSNCLDKFSLGYEKSEALYSWNVFNLPNNNYPIFWWNRYQNGTHRKTMFTRN